MVAKLKPDHESRRQLSMLLPINNRNGLSGQFLNQHSPLNDRSVKVVENRRAALKNLEKSGLRITQK